MESDLFIRIIQTEYETAVSEASRQMMQLDLEKMNVDNYLSTESITRLKHWFKYLMKTVMIRIGGKEASPEEAILFFSSKYFSSELDNNTYNVLKKMLLLFTDDELVEIFGTSAGGYIIKQMERT